MATTQFNRDVLASWYAKEHIKTDSGVRSVYYLPTNSPEREIRLLEVNDLIAELDDNAVEPVDFGVDYGSENEHKLFVMDVTPSQWDRIGQGSMSLPAGWSLERALVFHSS
jgi:hypothetical protein